MSQIKKSIYLDDAAYDFYSKLDSFYDAHVGHLIMSGVAQNGSNLNQVNFSFSSDFTREFYEALVYVMQRIKPSFKSMLISNKRLEVECIFYNFGGQFSNNQIYMMQNTMDWTSRENFNCQIWQMNPDSFYFDEIGTETIKKYWIT